MRTIDELEKDNKVFYQDIDLSVSDTLAFCIVASDYLRARRRRYPLALILDLSVLPEGINIDTYESDDTYEMDDISFTFNWSNKRIITRAYAVLNTNPELIYYLLWDFSKEYTDG